MPQHIRVWSVFHLCLAVDQVEMQPVYHTEWAGLIASEAEFFTIEIELWPVHDPVSSAYDLRVAFFICSCIFNCLFID